MVLLLKTDMQSIEHIFEIFAKVGGISGLVILLLFLMLNREIRDIKKQNEELALQIEASKNDIKMQVEKTKACILKIMYEFNMITDRRKRDKPVEVDRRNDGS